MANQTVTVDYDGKDYSMTPAEPQIIGLDDTITFKVTAAQGCCICFSPPSYFGRRLKLEMGTHGPYAPADNAPPPPPQVRVKYCITDINTRCTPAVAGKSGGIESYSIKVG
jgi:hypothetical protein